MHFKSLLKIIAFLASLMMYYSCSNVVFEKELVIENEEWTYEDSLTFGFEIHDTLSPYSLLLNISHTPEYGFQNLYVQMHTTFPSGKMEKQLVSLELANQAGVWNGKCSGRNCSVEIPLREKTKFRETGQYSLSIEQYMRKSPLAGLKSMKLSLVREKAG